MARVLLLAAGRSFRMAPVSDKNFLKFLGKPLIQHQFEMLISAGFRDIVVVGGKHNLEALKEFRRIFEKGSGKFRGKVRIEILEQKNLALGMAGGVLAAKRVWKKDEAMLLVSANDVATPKLFEKMAELGKKGEGKWEGALIAKKVSSYFPGGYLVTDRKGLVKKIVEKPGEGREPSDLVNLVTHLHFRPEVLFKYIEEVGSLRGSPEAGSRGFPAGGDEREGVRRRRLVGGTVGSPEIQDDRYELALQSWLEDGARFFAQPYKGFWQPVKYPWHVLTLMNDFLSKIEDVYFPRGRVNGKKAEVAKTAKLIGQNIYFGSGVKVMDYAVMQGPCYIGDETVIGTGSLVRSSHIGARCVIGYNSEIARSYVGDDCWFHTNYVGDSVIGNNVAFGSGTVTGNLRLDEQTVKVSIEKTWGGKKLVEKTDSGFQKLGAIIGDDVRVGINTSLMPGVKIGSGSLIGAGIVIAEDIPENSFARGDFKLKISTNQRKITRWAS